MMPILEHVALGFTTAAATGMVFVVMYRFLRGTGK